MPELDHLELDSDTRTAIKQALQSNQSIDSLKHKINIPILLLHECSLTAKASEITPTYLKAVETYHKERAHSYFRKHLAALKDIFKYSDIRFHLILFPVPKKQPIVDKFVASVGFYKG